MALRPGSLFEMSSHFMPLPRSSMMSASSSGDHLLCFFAGESDVCGMARRPAGPRRAAAAATPGTPTAPCAVGPGIWPARPKLNPPATVALEIPPPPIRGEDAAEADTGAKAAYGGAGNPPGGAIVAVVGGTDVDRVCWGGDTEDSFESEPLRRAAISTVTVSRRAVPRGATGS